MNIKKIGFWIFIICSSMFFILGKPAFAVVYLDEEGKCQFSGEFQTRGSMRTTDSKGFTSPRVADGQMVQHRNLLYLELNHNLTTFLQERGLRVDEVKYHLRGRVLYEGIYDYGPKAFRHLPGGNYVKNINDFQWHPCGSDHKASLWEGYVDVSKGPVFVRLGRQLLAWGETDVFRLLDNICPLDNTFGGIFEDLDDRRVPLIMARGIYNFRSIGPIDSVALEGFVVPGALDATVSPLSPPGTVYALPIPLTGWERQIKPNRDMENTRWGFRLQGVLPGNVNLAIAHFKSFLDEPAIRLKVFPQIPLGPPELQFTFKPVSITGGSLNYYNTTLNAVFRSEVAYLKDVPVFIPAINLAPAFGGSSKLPRKNQLRFSLAVDRDVWIRSICKAAQFNFTLQYTGQYFLQYDDGIRFPVHRYPDDNPTTCFGIRVKRYEQTLTLVVMNQSGWLTGNLLPNFIFAMDPRGAFLTQPSLEYKFEPFRLKLAYSAISGNFVGMGFFKDRDQVSLTFRYLF